MTMKNLDYTYLKLSNSKKISQTISLLRKYDANLSIGVIKQKIDSGEVLITHDITALVDLVDELNGIEPNEAFYQLVLDLVGLGDEVKLFDEVGEISVEQLRNAIDSWNQLNGYV